MARHELADVVDGAVMAPGQEGYDEARTMWNARFDRRPEVAVRCTSAAEVAATVRWAGDRGLPISVKGGGHSYAGNTVADGSVLIDLAGMSGIKVDAEDRVVRVEAGATWGQLDSATQEHGLATTGPTVSSVGVGGSILGGGT
jgi:FAD/FMN-containing dehydrogenase